MNGPLLLSFKGVVYFNNVEFKSLVIKTGSDFFLKKEKLIREYLAKD